MKKQLALSVMMLSLLLFAPVSLVASQGPYPIQDAVVSIGDVSPDGYESTDAAGNFLITGLGTGSFTGTVSAKGYMDKSISGTITQGGTTNLGNIYLDPSAVIEGTVLTHTGSPSPNSIVVLLDASNATRGVVSTGPDGTFTIDTDIPTGTYSIYASPPGSLFTYTGTEACSTITSGVSATQGSTTSGITLNLLQSGTISGQVTDDLNNGIAGVSVWATSNSNERYGNMATTDSTGHYSMTANLVAGSYNVSTPMFSSAAGYVINYSDVKTVTLTTGGTATANFKLHESGSIAGVVTTYDGTPAVGMSVAAYGTAGIGIATTGADGSYLINTNLGTGEYTVYAGSDVYNTATANVTIGELTSPVDIQLSYNLAWVTGKVSDSQGPLDHASVEGSYDVPNPWLPSMNSTKSDSDSTDSSGNYGLEIEVAGNWTSVTVALTATADGYSDMQQNATATKGQTTPNVNFVLQAGPRGSVSGRVVSNTEPPLLTADLTLVTSAATVAVGQVMTLSGTIAPSQTGTVTIYESINGSGWNVHSTRTLSGGAYSISFSFSDTPSNIGIHRFYATWPGNSEYNAAQSPTVEVNVTAKTMLTATLTLSTSSASISLGSQLTLSGSINPAQAGNVTILESVNGSAWAAIASKAFVGSGYTHTFTPAGLGTHRYYASWPGNADYNPADSQVVTVNVTEAPKQNATLTIQTTPTSVSPGQTVTVSGTITPSASGSVGIWQSVNGSAFTQVGTATLSAGAYSYQQAIAGSGTYQYRAQFAGNDQLNAAQSAVASVSSSQPAPAPDYTMYIVGGVVVAAVVLAVVFFLMKGKKK